MRFTLGVLAAVILAGGGWSVPVRAQGVPQGTYLQSCMDVSIRGDTLVATCRTRGGGSLRTTLNIRPCRGDIGNNNGVLSCSGGRGQAVAQPGPGPGPGYRTGPGYGAPYGQMPPPGYGYGPPR